MAVIKAGLSDPNTTFNFNGLDYKKGIWEIFYNGKEVDQDGNINKAKITVGIRNQTEPSYRLQRPIKISDYINGSGTPYSDLDTLVLDLTALLGFDNGGGLGSGINITQKVNQFNDLQDGSIDGDLAYVENSQGTQWLPNNLGGTYYPAGWYIWNGTDWVSDRNAIANQLEQNILQLSDNVADINQVESDLTAEESARIAADNALQSSIIDNSNDIVDLQNDVTDLQNDKRDLTAQKNSIEDDGGDLQLVGDELTPDPNKYYGTNSAGVKGYHDLPTGGDQAFVNESVLYKAFSDNNPSINISTTYQTLFYKAAVAGTFDSTAFAPVSNGVQLLKDLVNITIMGSHYVVTTNGARISLGTAIAIDGTPSNVEGGGYIRVASGHNEEPFGITETFPSLPAGTVITVVGKRNAGVGTTAQGVEDKAFLSVFGFIPDTPGVVLGFPEPIVTSISLT